MMRMHEPSRTGEGRSDPMWEDLAMPTDRDEDEHKDPLAVEFGRRGGLKGGRARADKLTADERSDIARRAAEARWGSRAEPASMPVALPSRVIAATSAGLLEALEGQRFGTILADPPWRFINRTGKVAPEHRRLARYETMTSAEIAALPVKEIAGDKSHLYLWTPNALVADGVPFTDGELAFVAASLFLPSIAP